ncbi:MAG: FAD-linked oxidase [Frankiales bacterium]|jgi:glycolate oxidase|nr:FAD-linked oxidase [Frankiales bacterium]
MSALLTELHSELPAEVITTDPDVMGGFAHDQAPWAEHGLPAAVVRPLTAQQVQATVLACLRTGTAIVPRGAGSGLSGGANALTGCVVISLDRMDRILEVDPLERLAVVQPGVVNDALRAAAAAHGLWYPPDPASSAWSTLGGNVATNAGGVCCVKYGVTGDYVLGLQVATGTGALVRLGRRTAKGVAGLDLTALMVGSEGTLGVITEVTVRLRPARAAERTVAGFFPSLVAAGRAVAAVAAAGITPSALELVDRRCLDAVDAWKNTGISSEAEALLLGRTDASGLEGEHEASTIVLCFEQAGATFAVQTSDPDEADALFAARRLALPALQRLGPVLTEDVCVPKAQLATMLALVGRAAERHDTTIATIAHAGDGNLHPLLLLRPGDPGATQRAQAAFDEIMAGALELGGTVTGEHGIGLLKRHGLRMELDPAVLEMQRAVKVALDPRGLLNPGKVLDG